MFQATANYTLAKTPDANGHYKITFSNFKDTNGYIKDSFNQNMANQNSYAVVENGDIVSVHVRWKYGSDSKDANMELVA